MKNTIMEGTSKRPPEPLEVVRTRKFAALRSDLWALKGFASDDEIRKYVEDVLDEIRTDEP